MPTSTATMTAPTATKVSKLPVSAKQSPPSKSAVATLRSLYPRAARAFLQRDVTLTHSLILSAFSNLQPPVSFASDILSSHRKKWDILRITLETTLCTSAPPQETLPPLLQSALQLSPPSLISMMHLRSLQLFTPTNRGKPHAEFLPSQILVTLVLASIKLEFVQVGREMIEDWLSLRNHSGYENNKDQKEEKDDAEGYEKVLETYCLHVLPRLDDWDYAREFLGYESELPQDRRMYLVQSLQVLHSQHLAYVEELRERERNIIISPSSSRTPTPRPLNGRVPSPSPSITSTSTTSTHTAVPLAPRPHTIPSSITPLTPLSRSQSPSQSRPSLSTTITARQSRTATPLPLPASVPQPQMPVSIPAPSLITLLKTSLIPHLTKSRLTFLVVMFLLPVLSFVFRLRRRRLRLSRGGSTLIVPQRHSGTAEETRRRLKAGWWSEVRKAVTDTFKMAAGGLA